MRYLLLMSLSLICAPLFALTQCDYSMCGPLGAPLQPTVTSHFIINESGYKMTDAQVPAGYSWGGTLDTGFHTTQLCCEDADQFFTVVSDDSKRRCTIDSGNNPSNGTIYANVRNNASTNNNMDCGIKELQHSAESYTYEIIIPPSN